VGLIERRKKTMTKNITFKKPMTFILGGLVGTGVVLLFAPGSGKETRKKIGGFAADIRDSAQCYAVRSKDRVIGASRMTRDYFKDRKSLLSASFEAGKKAYIDEKKKLTTVH
jgi:gas vesicle protein